MALLMAAAVKCSDPKLIKWLTSNPQPTVKYILVVDSTGRAIPWPLALGADKEPREKDGELR